MAQDTGMSFRGDMVAEGKVYYASQIGDESNGILWQTTTISGYGKAAITTVAEIRTNKGEVEISQSCYVAASDNVSALATKDVVASENITASEDVVASENVTASEDVVASENVTASEDVVASENVTASEDVVASENVTASEDVVASENVTASEDVVASENVTASEDAVATQTAASMAAEQTTYSGMDPVTDNGETVTEQVSTLGITSTSPDGAEMSTHCEGKNLEGSKIQSYEESFEVLNLGGTTQRYASMSGDVAKSVVKEDYVIEGKCQHSESFSIQNTRTENTPKWYEACP